MTPVLVGKGNVVAFVELELFSLEAKGFAARFAGHGPLERGVYVNRVDVIGELTTGYASRCWFFFVKRVHAITALSLFIF